MLCIKERNTEIKFVYEIKETRGEIAFLLISAFGYILNSVRYTGGWLSSSRPPFISTIPTLCAFAFIKKSRRVFKGNERSCRDNGEAIIKWIIVVLLMKLRLIKKSRYL